MSARRGFTLVEMLVVIGIIVVLAGILTPVAMHALRQGPELKCQRQLASIGKGLIIYQQRYGKYPPYSGREFLAELHRKGCVDDPRVFVCPHSDHAAADGWERIAKADLKEVPPGEGATSYAGRRNGERAHSIRRALRRKVSATMIPVASDGFATRADGGLETAHGDFAWVLFLDGHVERVEVGDLGSTLADEESEAPLEALKGD